MNAGEADQNKEKKSFWNTTLGIITKITAFLSAITALIIAYNNFRQVVVSPEMITPSSVGASPATSDSPPPITNTTPSNANAAEANAPGTAPDSAVIIPVEKKPDIRVTSFSVDPTQITLDKDAQPKSFTAILEAYNNGNSLAENCFFTLMSDGGVLGNATSESFSLDPNSKKQVVITATISNSGKITAKLSSSNDVEKVSPEKYITVYAYGTIHHRILKTEK
jgi:hypothetical protein